MAKKKAEIKKVNAVSCNDCIYQDSTGVYPGIMWCNKIKMPLPKNKLKNCVHKIEK